MSILREASTAAAVTVAGVGIAIGGVGLASADDTSTDQESTSASGSATPGEARGHGQGPGGRGGAGLPVAELAEALGLDEADVTAALEAIRDESKPEAPAEGEARTQPSEADREARQAEMVSALAEELGVSEQEITDALDSVQSENQSEARTGLSDRLDEAVTDGTLTESDKESVLKAFDAGVLGGGHGGHGGPGEADAES